MINIKSIKSIRNNKPIYFNMYQHIDACMVVFEKDDDDEFLVKIIGREKDFVGDFKSQEQAYKFYNDLIQLIVKQEDSTYLEIDIADYGYREEII